ncbi:hypothetical protein Leryth_024284 [Lithospermum erythrorhizon]|nr:hypothetical protein Leryth_024284 [Lithospermum erythrorhizon]
MDREEANQNEGNAKPIKTKKNDGNSMFDPDEEKEELLSPSSRMFHEPNYNIHIVAIMGWKARNGPNLDLIKETLSTTVLNHPHFSSVQVMDEKDEGKVRWVASQVNLDNHIIVEELDPKMEISEDKVIDDYLSNLSRTPMDKSKPLWELHLLVFKPSNSSKKLFLSDGVSIFRIHHSVGDGISLVSILLSCTRKTSDPNSPPKLNIPNIRKLSTSRTINYHGGLFSKLWCYFIMLWLKIRVLSFSIVDLMMFVATAMFLKDTETPIKSSKINNDNDPEYRRFVLRTVNLDDIKLVKNATNATVNDVVLGVIQAGLSRYLKRRYGEDDDVVIKGVGHKKTNLITREIKCRATVLINLRPLFGTNAMEEINEKNIPRVKQGNCFGFVLLPLKISMLDNPLDHVRLAKATMDRKKQSLEVLWTSYILDRLLKLFGYKAATTLAERVPLHTTLGFSNVMGPTEEISFCDHPMTFMAATCYGQPTPLMIHVVSYTNKLTFAISVDERTIPDPCQFGDAFLDSLEDMKKAVVGTKTHSSPFQ